MYTARPCEAGEGHRCATCCKFFLKLERHAKKIDLHKSLHYRFYILNGYIIVGLQNRTCITGLQSHFTYQAMSLQRLRGAKDWLLCQFFFLKGRGGYKCPVGAGL